VEILYDLSDGKAVNVAKDVILKTQDFFTLKKQIECIENEASPTTTKSPDICLEFQSTKYIFDAYNGSSEKEIKAKLRMYIDEFETNHVYVFSSGVKK
jgi:hypothetical protein